MFWHNQKHALTLFEACETFWLAGKTQLVSSSFQTQYIVHFKITIQGSREKKKDDVLVKKSRSTTTKDLIDKAGKTTTTTISFSTKID